MKQPKKKLGKKGKILLGIGIVLLVIIVLGIVGYVRLRQNADEIFDYDDFSGDITYSNYYSGVVEAQQILEVQRDSSKEIDQVYVNVGDEVTAGQSLFSYKTDEATLELEQAKIELQSLGTDVSDYNNQITNLTNEMNAADQSLKAEYQMQINELQTTLKQTQLSQKTKQAQIDSLEKTISQATVTSTIDGVVKSIASTSSTEGAYMTILATGTYQVKATVDEMNVSSLYEGQTVTIRSRVDDSTWTGSISKVDTDNKASSQSSDSYYYSDSSSGEQTTKYYFYVTLDDATGLLLGQHVYVEPEIAYYDETLDEETFELDATDDGVSVTYEEGVDTEAEVEEP